MKKNLKSKIKENLGDAVAEVVFSIILLGIGACVLALFGVGGDAEWLDGDLLILIGLGVIIIPVGVISAIVHAIKKKKKTKEKTEDTPEESSARPSPDKYLGRFDPKMKNR